MLTRFLLCSALWLVTISSNALTPQQQSLYNVYRELIEINTVHPHGDNTAAAEAMAKRLRSAGFTDQEINIVIPEPKKGNLIVRLRGSGELKPLLLLAHIDVVEAKREDWSVEPFRLTEKEGYYYGRGTLDDKAMAAIFITNLIRYKQEGLPSKRDLIVALTADEEGGTHNGVAWLLKNHRDLIDAEFAINEGGSGILKNGKPLYHAVQGSEKMYLSFDFETNNPGGHSSLPQKDNAIYELSEALTRLSKFAFPVKLSVVTRMYFAKIANIEGDRLKQDMLALVDNRADEAALKRLSAEPRYNAQLRTTCVATRMEAGHADNALPQRAKATVNCRLLPGEEPEHVRNQLQKIAGDKVKVTTRGEPRPSAASVPHPAVMNTITRISETFWPGTPIVPVMSAGATDGLRLRNADIPTYGVSGIFVEFDDIRIHGRDERIGVKQLYDAQEFLYRLVKEFALGR